MVVALSIWSTGIDRSLRLDQVIVHIDASYISISDTYDRLLG